MNAKPPSQPTAVPLSTVLAARYARNQAAYRRRQKQAGVPDYHQINAAIRQGLLATVAVMKPEARLRFLHLIQHKALESLLEKGFANAKAASELSKALGLATASVPNEQASSLTDELKQ